MIRDPRDVLLVSSPCYVDITGVARLLDVTLSPVAESARGFSLENLEVAIRTQRAAHRGRSPSCPIDQRS